MISKNILTVLLVVLGCSSAMATERVTMFCSFDAIAEGYENAEYAVNLIKDDYYFYNSDGSIGNVKDQPIIAMGDVADGNSCFDFLIYDGNAYRAIPSGCGWKVFQSRVFNLNTGTVKCQLMDGWFATPTPTASKRSIIIKDTVRIRDTVFVEKIKARIDTIYLPFKDSITPADTPYVSIRSPISVSNTIKNNIGGLRYRYENHLRNHPMVKGIIRVKIRIANSGDVIKCTIIENTTGDDILANELIGGVENITFDSIKYPDDEVITYAFHFKL